MKETLEEKEIEKGSSERMKGHDMRKKWMRKIVIHIYCELCVPSTAQCENVPRKRYIIFSSENNRGKPAAEG